MNKRFWFYNEWDISPRTGSWKEWFRNNFRGSDEYGHHTVVIPLGKGRAMVIAYRAGYKGTRKCEFCVEARKQTLDFEQEMYYVQTYWRIEELDDVHTLDMDLWDKALGVI